MRFDGARRALPLAVLLACAGTMIFPLPAVAASRCTKTCRRETAECKQTQCTGLSGRTREACVERCEGIGGCPGIGTLAYVVSTCTADAFRQRLEIRHGDCDPVTVLDFPGRVQV